MRASGFSLLEIVIVIAITSILSGISYVSYQHYVTAARRTEAKTALYELAHKLEHYYAENHTYKGATLAALQAAAVTENGFYALHIAAQEQNYLLSAAPQKTQAEQDQKCGALTLDDAGRRQITGVETPANCW